MAETEVLETPAVEVTNSDKIIAVFTDNGGTLSVDKLLELSGIPLEELQEEILNLDLDGLLRSVAPGTYQYIKPLFSLPKDHPFVQRVPGIYPDIPFDDYRLLDAANASLLKKFKRSPAHVHHEVALRNPEADNVSNDNNNLFIGRAVHCAVLEPERFLEEFIVAECEARTAKIYKDTRKANPSKSVITKKELVLIKGISESLMRHSEAYKLLSCESYNELTVVWIDKKTGVLCKGRVDRYISDQDDDRIIVDLKTTENAQREAFSKSIDQWQYHVSGSFYCTGFETILKKPHTRFTMIACEKEPPYELAVYELDAPDLEVGRKKHESYLKRYKTCEENNSWPGYPNIIQSISLPAWANRDED